VEHICLLDVQEELGDVRLTAETLGHADLGSVSGYTTISQGRWDQVRETMQDRGL
jgi:site-specific recombinase XerD